MHKNIRWKQHSKYPGYLFSDSGSILRTEYRLKGIARKELYGVTKQTGYKEFTILINGKFKGIRAHKIIAELFCEKPTNATVVNHKNGIKTDNRAVNLEWVTQSDNLRHSYNVLGNKHPRAKLDKKTVIKILVDMSCGMSTRKAAVKYNISRSTICMIKSGRNWKKIDRSNILTTIPGGSE